MLLHIILPLIRLIALPVGRGNSPAGSGCVAAWGGNLQPERCLDVEDTIKQRERLTRLPGLIQLAILRVIAMTPLNAYGTAITSEVSRNIGRDVADGQIYVALSRLEQQGFIQSRVEMVQMPSERSRGRPRKYYALTALGRRALECAGALTSTTGPFTQPRGGDEEVEWKGPMPAPVVG
ncbi:PadR family transcriptional regulator [Methylocystis iwaonis]|uniref:PadR family transcriptional regulator n=1 Tax=Methylocystis iwaonis TaxID=2885079 RepID=UPI0039B5C933